MKRCGICSKDGVVKLIDLGDQPVSSHYLGKQSEKYYTHALSLGQCRACGTIQLFDRFPWKKLTPKYSWSVRYTEPEEHLDEFAIKLTELSGITKDSKICGISFKDDTLLDRLRKRGYRKVRSINKKDLQIRNTVYGIETVQHHFTQKTAQNIAKRIGKQDILIVRHFLEHVYDIKGFIKASNELLSPNGYLVFEVPGVDKAIEYFDYTTIWEEHLVYFTRETFRSFLKVSGYTIDYYKEVKYPLENSFLAIVRLKDGTVASLSQDIVQREKEKFERYARAFDGQKKKLLNMLAGYRSVVLFGAGHLASVWVNIFNVSQYIDCFIDEDMNKSGLRMPGNKLQIRQLFNSGVSIDLCLLTSNPRNEKAIKKNNQKFFSRVGTVKSIFPQTRSYHGL